MTAPAALRRCVAGPASHSAAVIPLGAGTVPCDGPPGTGLLAYVVSAGEYDDNRVLAVFADPGQAARWARRWERSRRHALDRETSVTAHPFVPAGGRAPSPRGVA